MTEEMVRALFLVAGIDVLNLWKIENKYWPEAYVEERRASPWWLVQTKWGMIEIGWRKRVISIDWKDTPLREINLTLEDVTKTETMIHAWTYIKAVEYLNSLRNHLKGIEQKAITSVDV